MSLYYFANSHVLDSFQWWKQLCFILLFEKIMLMNFIWKEFTERTLLFLTRRPKMMAGIFFIVSSGFWILFNCFFFFFKWWNCVRCVEILFATSVVRPRADVAYCIHAIARRLAKTRNWTVLVIVFFFFFLWFQCYFYDVKMKLNVILVVFCFVIKK